MNPLEPAPTPFDLRWRLFGIHFRVHPSFWLVGLLFGMMSAPRENTVLFILIWVLSMFVSVLWHEMGHVLMGRLFGEPGHILLYSMGGYAMGFYQNLQRWQRILVASAGPGAGFLFLALIALFDNKYWNYLTNWYNLPWLQTPWCVMDHIVPLFAVDHRWYLWLMQMLIWMNLFWSLMNLLPVIPLDGGNILKEICTGISPRAGLRFALGLSFLIAGLVALYSGFVYARRGDLPYPPLDPLFNIILFGMLAMQNFAMLRSVEAEQRRWDYMDD